MTVTKNSPQQMQRPIMPQQPRSIDEFFTYEVDFLALAAGATANGNIAIESSSDFRWIKGCFFADIAVAAQTQSTQIIPLCTVLITDSGSGQQLSSAAMPVTSVFGTGQIPFILPVSRVFTARSNIQVTVVNFSAASTYNLRLSFIGAKVYKF